MGLPVRECGRARSLPPKHTPGELPREILHSPSLAHYPLHCNSQGPMQDMMRFWRASGTPASAAVARSEAATFHTGPCPPH